MRTFTDNQGRQWPVVINVNQLKLVRDSIPVEHKNAEGETERIGFDLLGGPTHDITEVFKQLSDDPILLVDTIYVLCRKEAEDRKVSDVQFGEALTGDAIDGATDALMEALVDFFPKALRGQYQKMLTIARAAATKLNDKIMSKIDQLTPERIITEVERGFGSTSTNSQGKSASIPARTRTVK